MKNPVRIIVLLVQCLGFAASMQAQPRTITNGLVVHLTFDNTLSDNSGRGNNGTYDSHNGLVTNPPAPTYVAGKIGQAFQFTTALDASLIDFVTLHYPNDLKFGATSNWSVSCWINHTNNVGDPAIIANKNWWSSGKAATNAAVLNPRACSSVARVGTLGTGRTQAKLSGEPV